MKDGPGLILPRNMDRAALLDLLDDIRRRVASGDSLEGQLLWVLPQQVGADPDSYDVIARYRTAGPGGMKIIGVPS